MLKLYCCPDCDGDLYGEVVSHDFDTTPSFEIVMVEVVEGCCSECNYKGTFQTVS